MSSHGETVGRWPQFLGRRKKRVKVDLNIAPLMIPVAHGRHEKDLVVLHETVSRDAKGLADVLAVSRFMPTKGYGIHGIIDGEGNLAWDVFGDTHVLYHAASEGHMINSRAIGFELISRVMLDLPDNQRRFEWWWERNPLIDKLAKTLAYLHRVHRIPLQYSNAVQPGITTHWDVSKTFDVPGGHTDCWPRHKGGYFPVLRIVRRAQFFSKRGW